MICLESRTDWLAIEVMHVFNFINKPIPERLYPNVARQIFEVFKSETEQLAFEALDNGDNGLTIG